MQFSVRDEAWAVQEVPNATPSFRMNAYCVCGGTAWLDFFFFFFNYPVSLCSLPTLLQSLRSLPLLANASAGGRQAIKIIFKHNINET